jgi:hypothetical protein
MNRKGRGGHVCHPNNSPGETVPASDRRIALMALAYISHLHIALSGFITATGLAIAGLSWYGVRRGERWAFTALPPLPSRSSDMPPASPPEPANNPSRH